MKKNVGLPVLVWFLAGLWVAGCASTPDYIPPEPALPWAPVFEVTDTGAVLIYDPTRFAQESEVHSVKVLGSFNSWREEEAWALEADGQGRFTLSLTRAQVDIPGNSGAPEFQFILNESDRISGLRAPRGQKFGNNFVILWPGVTEEEMARRDAQNSVVKTEHASLAELTNFRGLSGGTLAEGRLFRSYHPFIASRSFQSERPRLAGVQQLMEENQVAAVINLSDSERDFGAGRTPAYYYNLYTSGRVLLAPTHYNTVYFESDGDEFLNEVKTIFEFIAATPGPYLVHCRLGTDRTGIITALLEIMAGVPWAAIEADFVLSNEMGIREFRGPELLRNSIAKVLGADPLQTPELTQALISALRGRGLDLSLLQAVQTRLST